MHTVLVCFVWLLLLTRQQGISDSTVITHWPKTTDKLAELDTKGQKYASAPSCHYFPLSDPLGWMDRCWWPMLCPHLTSSMGTTRQVVLVAITGTTKLVPTHLVKSVQLIGRSSTRRFHLRVLDLPMSCSDLTGWREYQDGYHVTAPVTFK